MSAEQESKLPDCEFHIENLVVQLDETLPSRIEVISPLMGRLMPVLRRSCCPLEHEFAVELALREALANAILHGNRQDPRKKVRVCCACEADQGILIIVKDQGEGFDPARVPDPIRGRRIHSEHGRGIYLLNLFMDEVRFERGGTEIHMRKRTASRQ